MPPVRVQAAQVGVELGAGLELAPAGVARQRRHARARVGHEDVHGHAGRERQERRELEAGGQLEGAGEREAVPAVDRARPELALEVVRVDRAVRERDLVVVRVVVGLRQRVRGEQAVAARPLLDRDEEALVARADARLDVHHPVRPADDRVVDLPHRPADEEVRPLVPDAVDAQEEVARDARPRRRGSSAAPAATASRCR